MGLGLISLIGLIWQLGRGVQRTQHEPWHWSWRETVVAGTAVLPLLLVWLWGETADYSPYFTLALPLFDPLLGLGLLGLITAVFVGIEPK